MKKIEITEKDDPEKVQLRIHFSNLLATQDQKYDERRFRSKLGYEKSQITEFQDGTPETELSEEKKRMPAVKRKTGAKRTDTKSLPCHCFPRANNGDGAKHVISDLGGPWGHLKRALNRAAKGIRMDIYKQIPSLELLHFEPASVDLGSEDGIVLTEVLEPRSRGKSREATLYETVLNRTIDVTLNISKTCPLTGEEIKALLVSMRDLDGFGPSKRGKVDKIEVLN